MIRFNRTDPSLAGSNYKPGELPGGPYLAIVKAVGDPTRNNRVSVALARDGKNLDNKKLGLMLLLLYLVTVLHLFKVVLVGVVKTRMTAAHLMAYTFLNQTLAHTAL